MPVGNSDAVATNTHTHTHTHTHKGIIDTCIHAYVPAGSTDPIGPAARALHSGQCCFGQPTAHHTICIIKKKAYYIHGVFMCV